MAEEWRPIAALDGAYEASSDGRIRNAKTKRVKSIVYDGRYCKFGYDYVFGGVRNQGWYRVHRAIAETFIANPDGKPTVNHKDGNRTNNAVENLEWATAKEQSRHAAEVLHRNCGEDNYNATITNETARAIKLLYHCGGMKINRISELLNVKKTIVNRIVRGERWKYI